MELLQVKGRPHEFLQIFRKGVQALIKSLKVVLDLFAMKLNVPGGFLENGLLLHYGDSGRHTAAVASPRTLAAVAPGG